MRSRRGFTLIELMIVILIVAVLAAVLTPLIRARIDAAKWAEAKSGIGNIASGVRAYWAEHQDEAADGTMTEPTRDDICVDADLEGKYFSEECYSLVIDSYDADGIYFTITVDASASDKDAPPTNPETVEFQMLAEGESIWTHTGPSS